MKVVIRDISIIKCTEIILGIVYNFLHNVLDNIDFKYRYLCVCIMTILSIGTILSIYSAYVVGLSTICKYIF